jgi:AsmA protein
VVLPESTTKALIQQVSTSKAKRAPRRLARALVLTVLTILAAGLVAPFINAARFSGSLRAALESSLGRKVDFKSVHFALFSGPGFSLEEVRISEDPRYGLEPFAFVPVLEARVRLDKLLFGQIRLSSIRLVDPYLNLVKRSDGTWNVVEMLERLSAPRRAPLNLFPAFEVSGGRIDFKFGTRKPILYIADSDLSIYPQRSGKVYIQFSGSPARTDRAGNGFSHFRGSVNWYTRQPKANQLEADITLDESNLSEVTTLLEGHDIGIHGTVTSHARIAGPLNGLHLGGELVLDDVHRWDLLPASGDEWRIRYDGNLDLIAHRCDIQTVPSRQNEPAPMSVQMHINNFLTRPEWSFVANLQRAPVDQLLPLAKRMGIAVPEGLSLGGSLNGAVGYSNTNGFSGGVAIENVVATVPDLPPLRSASASATILSDHVHFYPAIIQTSAGGTLRAGGDYYYSGDAARVSLSADDFSISALKNTAAAWFGAPEALSAFSNGEITGQLNYARSKQNGAASDANKISWSGEFQLTDGILNLPGVASPLKDAQGRVKFDPETFDLTRFSAKLGGDTLHASYHYNALAKRMERVHIQLPAAALEQLENQLSPALQAQSLLVKLRVVRRSIPAWLATRNLEGDLDVNQFLVNQTALGSLSTHFIWRGPIVQFTSFQLAQGDALVRGKGTVNLTSYAPRLQFQAIASRFRWGGGLVNADGECETSGTGMDSIRNLRANGTFSGENISLSPTDFFDNISGHFDFSFADDEPNLRLTGIEALQDEEEWNGEAATQASGKLVIDLAHAGRQLHVVSALLLEGPTLLPHPTTVNTLSDDGRPLR